MSFNWSFKDNLVIDNNKYLKWLSPNNISQNIIGVDANSNLNINSSTAGDLYLNSNNNGSNTFINVSNSQNVFVSSKLAVGINTTSNINANVVLNGNPNALSWIGLNANTGKIGISGNSDTSGTMMVLYGNNTTDGNAGSANFYAGNVTTGTINFFVNNSSQVMQVLTSGNINFSPNGNSVSLSISPTQSLFSNQVVISNTSIASGATTGALQVAGGISVSGNAYVSGTLNISSVTGNLNFNSTVISSSYTTGALYISGGFGIACSVAASSQTAGGALSVAGGLALGQNAIIGGNVVIYDSTDSISSQTGSLVLYGGAGINGQINIRTNKSSQIRIAPVNTGNESSIYFAKNNDYTTTGSWIIGQNAGNVTTSGNFGIYGSSNGLYMSFNETNNNITILKSSDFVNGITASNINFTGNLYQNGGLYVSSQWFGTTGSLVYYGSSGSVNVGIGTTNPSYTLDVNGDINFTGNLYQNGTLFSGGGGGGTGGGSSQWSDGTTGTIFYGTSANVFVGIGTSNPSTNLEVNNTIKTTNLNVTGNATMTNLLLVGATLGNIVTNNVNYGISNVYSGSFAAANNVGTPTNVTGLLFSNTSTTSFTCKLTVSISATTSLYEYFNIDGIYTSTGWQLYMDSEGDVSGVVFTITSDGQIQYTSTDVSDWTASVFRYTVTQTTSTGTYASLLNPTVGSYSIDSIQLNNTSVAVAGTNTGAFYSLGGVTIGKNLQVYSTTNSTALGSGGSLTVLGGGAISKDMYIGGSLVAISNSNTLGSLVTTGGNIGIGTNSPSYTLDVSGTGRITTSLTTGALYATNVTSTNQVATNMSSGTMNLSTGLTSASIQVTNLNSTNITVGTLNVNTSITTANLSGNNATIATARITTNLIALGNSNTLGSLVTTGGNIGIGTTSPGYTLDITGNINFTGNLTQNGGAFGGTSQWSTFGSNIAYTTGNVGIGTTSPSYTLDVSGTGRITTSLTTGAVYATNMTTINLVGTSVSSGTIYSNVQPISVRLLNSDVDSSADLRYYNVNIDNQNNVYVSGYTSGTQSNFYALDGSTIVTTIGNLSTVGNTVGFLTKYNSSGIFNYNLKIDGVNNEYFYSSQLDYLNNLYIIGQTNSTQCNIYATNGSSILSTIGNSSTSFGIGLLIKYSSTGNLNYYLKGPYFSSMAIDSLNNIYVAGYTSLTQENFYASNGSTIVGTVGTISSSLNGVFITKYNSLGTLNYILKIDANAAVSIKTDNLNNVYTLGNSSATQANFRAANGSIVSTIGNIGSNDIFLAKYNSSGTFNYVLRMGGTKTDVPFSLATDSVNNVYVSGYTTSTQCNFYATNGSSIVASMGNLSGYAGFVVKYDSSGTLNYVLKTDSNNIYGYSMTTDYINNLYVSAYTTSTLSNFYTTDGSTIVATMGNLNGNTYLSFLAKYDSYGKLLSFLPIDGINSDNVVSVAVDSYINPYVAGYTLSTLANFYAADGTTVLATNGSLKNTAFVAQYNYPNYPLDISGIGRISGLTTTSITTAAMSSLNQTIGTLNVNTSITTANLSANNATVANLLTTALQVGTSGNTMNTIQSGTYNASSGSGTWTITFPNAFSGTPKIFTTLYQSNTTYSFWIHVTSVSNTNFTYKQYLGTIAANATIGVATDSHTVYWMAVL